mgnify:CR=1 FL=1
MCFLKEIQRIFLSEIQQIWKHKIGKRVYNIGTPANAFQMATSKQLLLERAQRLVIGLPEKLVEPHFGYVRDGVFAKGHLRVPFSLSFKASLSAKFLLW